MCFFTNLINTAFNNYQFSKKITSKPYMQILKIEMENDFKIVTRCWKHWEGMLH